ncbi:periplasmic septal ring factor [alpha proteobacterium U9-1i]|nr:periplasmic septal ring factor [alpha proteobacterium U9-1i]
MARALVLIAFLAAGCASQSAPIAYGRGGPTQMSRQIPQRAPPQTPVRRDPQTQAAPDWADGEGTPLSEYALRPEEAQPYDPARLPRTHRVARNESLWDISDRYQIPLRALAEQNRLSPPYALAPGATIELPPPRTHTVARGETLRDIAERYAMDYRSLALLNRLQPPYNVARGDQIVLPAVPGAWAAEVMATPAPSEPATQTPVGPARFQWPLRGEVLERFGARAGGGRIDGIEIGTRAGAAIGAAADGDVVYAGSDVEGYQTLVLVRHPDGYVTAYGYARRALVREGQRVRAGEPLAEAGERLLFQVRRGREAVDPLPLLGS